MEGIRVVTAANGIDGLGKCKSEKPDLIITDLMIPGLDGIAMIKSLRADSVCAKVPVLAEIAIQAGANGVLCKSEAGDSLVSMVKALLPVTN
jgi:DNA-binding response OmpR family regulator